MQEKDRQKLVELLLVTSIVRERTTRIQTQIHKLSSKPPGKVLTVNLGQYKMETMLEWYPGFIFTNKISIWLFLVFLENCICVIVPVQLTGYAHM